MRTAYTKFVETLPCLVCGGPAQCHHVRTKGRQGQVDECNAVPLCSSHHTGFAGVHGLGRRTFARRYRLCLPAEALLVHLKWLRSWRQTLYTSAADLL